MEWPWLFRFDKLLDFKNPDYSVADAQADRARIYAWAILGVVVWLVYQSLWVN